MTDGPIEVVTDPDLIARAIAGGAAPTIAEQDPEEAARAIVARLLSAENEDELFGSRGAVHAEDVLNVPLTIRTVKWQRSSFENGASIYAVLEVVDDNGEAFVVTCGSRNVMAVVLWLDTHGKLPTAYQVEIVRADRASAGGFYPMWLERVSTAA